MLKKAVASTPVLRYYNLADEVTIQCDASQSGLGAALMQNGQPVPFASRVLTPPETRYAQIEKELLAIVFACDRFEVYIYGRDHVTIESDHKPKEMIVLKPLSSATKRLQRMLLQLQTYTLDVKYKKGEHMYLADTLSRAYIPEVNVCDFVYELEELDHRESLPVSQERWQQLNHASENDNVCRELRATIQNGWPENNFGGSGMRASLLRLSRRVDNPRKPDIQRTVVGRTSCGTYRADISGTRESH